MYFVAVLFAIIAAALGQLLFQTPLGNTPLTLGPGPVIVSGNPQLPLGPVPVIVSGNSPLPPVVWPGITHISGSHPFGM
ncbi:hypothetical protein V3C99_010212 [Haemonchus contortus]